MTKYEYFLVVDNKPISAFTTNNIVTKNITKLVPKK